MAQRNLDGEIAIPDIENTLEGAGRVPENNRKYTFLQDLIKQSIDPSISEERRQLVLKAIEEERKREERDHEYRMSLMGGLRYLLCGPGQSTSTAASTVIFIIFFLFLGIYYVAC